MRSNHQQKIPRLNQARTARLLTLAALMAFPWCTAALAADDARSRIVESSLKDLSARNDAAVSSSQLRSQRSEDLLGNPQVRFSNEPRPSSEALIDTEVQSSLHRLRRETVSTQTADGREARINESLDRAVNDP